jgi:hypothetical protein
MRTRLALFLLLCVHCDSRSLATQREGKATASDTRGKIPGEWRGHSECVDKNSACRDEINVYRFSKLARDPNEFYVTASKVVDGKEIVMGGGNWKFDAERAVLESLSPSIRLVVRGDQMEGALALANGTVYRRIYLKKEN